MPKFGKRKIGAAQFQLQQVREKQSQKFGPKKFGAKKAAIMAGELADAETAVTDAAMPAGEPPTTSIKQMAEALGENVEHLDQFLSLEKERPGGLRKGALKLFLGTELAKEDDARDEVIAEIQALLKTA